MAGLLLCLWGCTPLMGCLIPQDDQVLPDLPPRKNSPPRIVSNLPKQSISYFTSAMCSAQNVPFKVVVSDDDVSDTLRSLWLIDYDPSLGSAASAPFIPNAVTSRGQPLRDMPEPTAQSFKSALANLTAGTHLLTVYVADREFQEFTGVVATVEREIFVGDASVPDTGFTDSFTWVLKVESCP
ncbi:MAG: hypothetical protein ACOZQL_22750 [Myxococcota bacterium]